MTILLPKNVSYKSEYRVRFSFFFGNSRKEKLSRLMNEALQHFPDVMFQARCLIYKNISNYVQAVGKVSHIMSFLGLHSPLWSFFLISYYIMYISAFFLSVNVAVVRNESPSYIQAYYSLHGAESFLRS